MINGRKVNGITRNSSIVKFSVMKNGPRGIGSLVASLSSIQVWCGEQIIVGQ